MSNPKPSANETSSKTLIDALVERDVKGIRVKAKIKAGILREDGGGHCSPRCVRAPHG